MKGRPISSIKPRFNDSPCWKNILKVREHYYAGRKIMLGNGNLCRFWDEAFGPKPIPLRERFPEIYGVCRDQE